MLSQKEKVINQCEGLRSLFKFQLGSENMTNNAASM